MHLILRGVPDATMQADFQHGRRIHKGTMRLDIDDVKGCEEDVSAKEPTISIIENAVKSTVTGDESPPGQT